MPILSTPSPGESYFASALKRWSDGSSNIILLCIAKTIRTMGFGAISIVLALFLLQRGFSNVEVGMLLSATLLEDAVVTTLAAMLANRVGVKTILYVACAAIVIGGIVLATAELKSILMFAVVCGIVSPAGYEGGPFAPMEQTIISSSTTSQKLTGAFSWYNTVGFGGAALGALLAGLCVAWMNFAPVIQAYQTIFMGYSVGGVVMAIIYSLVRLSPTASGTPNETNSNTSRQAVRETDTETAKQVEVSRGETVTPPIQSSDTFTPATQNQSKPETSPPNKTPEPSRSSRKFIWQLAGLQCVDAFGGGFIVQSLLTLWFYERYQADATFLGPVYSICNIIAALSFLFAPLVVKRLGLLNTMVFTHLPCSLALCLMPFLPTAWWAAGLLVLRSGFSSMDIPVRQAYTMLIVAEKDRPFAAGLTTSTRAIAQGIAPTLTGLMLQNVMSGMPLILAGIFKSIYDVSLYFCFKNVPVHQDHRSNDGNETDQDEKAVVSAS